MPATAVIAAHCEGYCGRTSATMRTARSRSSSGYLLGRPITQILPRSGVSGNAGTSHNDDCDFSYSVSKSHLGCPLNVPIGHEDTPFGWSFQTSCHRSDLDVVGMSSTTRKWRRLRRDLNSRWWYCPRLGESLQQVVRGLSRSLGTAML